MVNILEKISELEKTYKLDLNKIEQVYGYIPIYDKVLPLIKHKKNNGFTHYDWEATEADVTAAFLQVSKYFPKLK